MGSRWFIPGSLLVFAGLMAGLWTYLSASVDNTPRTSRVFDESNAAIEQQAVQKEPASVKKTPPRPPASNAGFQQIAEHLDDSALQLRERLIEHGGIELAKSQAALQGGQFERALRSAEKVLTSSRDNSRALSIRAAALVGLSRWDEGVRAYAHLVELSPTDRTARYNYAALLYRRGSFGEAAEQFRELLAQDPDHSEALFNLATLAQRDGRATEARECWTRFTRLHPGTSDAWFHFGTLLADLEEWHDAARCFGIFHALQPEDPDGTVNFAQSLFKCEQPELAYEVLVQAATHLPCNEDIQHSLWEICMDHPR